MPPVDGERSGEGYVMGQWEGNGEYAALEETLRRLIRVWV